MNHLPRLLRGPTLAVLSSIGLLLGATQANAALSLDFQVSPDPINVGDTFTIDIIAQDIFSGTGHSGSDEVTSFGYDWDLSNASLLSIIGSPSITPNLTDPYTDESASATADLLAFAAGEPIVEGTGQVDALITQFSFTALQAGSTVFSIDGSVPDTNLERGFYYLDLVDPLGFSGNVSITVQGVPLPASPLLLLAGLGLLGLARRRR